MHPKIKVLVIVGLFTAVFVTAYAKLSNFGNGNQISVSGLVTAAAPDYFRIDTGKKTITVEMDDWDWYAEGTQLHKGDSVIVYGKIDNDLLQRRTIEADSVYVKNLNTYFYASDADEEDAGFPRFTLNALQNVNDGTHIEVYGRVASKSGRRFTLNTGKYLLTVDTSKMGYNPLDDRGYQQIKVSDRVYVYGTVDETLYDRKLITANTVVSFKAQLRGANRRVSQNSGVSK